MEITIRGAVLPALLAGCMMPAAAAEKKEFRYPVAAGASVYLANPFGNVTVRAAAGRQIAVSATPHSDKVEVDAARNGNRIELRSHLLQRGASNDAASVDYELQVPADSNVTVDGGSGTVKVQGLNGGDVAVQTETGRIEVEAVSRAHLNLRSVSGAITVANSSNARVDANTGGDISLEKVSGPRVTAATSKGGIRYKGDPGEGGEYSLTSHSGDIDVALPEGASVDVTARSISGSVQNDFPLEAKAHPTFAASSRAVAGVARQGAAMLQVSSFSGKIRVHKQ